MQNSTNSTAPIALGVATVIGALARRRRRRDPAHAPGHRHKAPPDAEPAPTTVVTGTERRDQPWIRRSHSDSQKRRFRR